MNRLLEKDSGIQTKILTLIQLSGGVVSSAEITSLVALCEYSTNNTIHLDAKNREGICRGYGITDSALSTAMHRLEKKKLIARNGKTISLHPMFSGIGELKALVIKFLPQG